MNPTPYEWPDQHLTRYASPELNQAARSGFIAAYSGGRMEDNPYPEASMRGAIWQDHFILGQVHRDRVAALRLLESGAIEHHVAPKTKHDRLILVLFSVAASVGIFALAGAMGVSRPIAIGLGVALAGVWRATK